MGFGNPVRSDDGIGCYVIDQLRATCEGQPGVGLFDMGTSAFEVLFQLRGHQRIRIVDAVINTGDAPGTLFKLPAEAVEAAIQDDPMVFLHSLKWDQALSYTRKILGDEYPTDIEVYLISVDNTRLEIGLSEPVREAGDRVVALVRDELNELMQTL